LKVIELGSKEGDVYNNLGNSYTRLFNYNEALKAYLKAVKMNPKEPQWVFNLGVAYTNLEKYD